MYALSPEAIAGWLGRRRIWSRKEVALHASSLQPLNLRDQLMSAIVIEIHSRCMAVNGL
jgi:hypothetical protein